MQDGLCGIGWGIEYLNQQGFIQADTDDILVDIDSQIILLDLKRMMDHTLATGREGILYYWLCRCRNFQKNKKYPFDKRYHNLLSDISSHTECNYECQFVKKMLIPFFLQNKQNDFDLFFPFSFNPFSILDKSIKDYDFGLKEGLAGIGLKKILHETSLFV